MFNMFKTIDGNEIKDGIKLDFETGYSIEIIYLPGYGYSCLVKKDNVIVPNVSISIQNDHIQDGGLSEVEVCERIYKVSCLK